MIGYITLGTNNVAKAAEFYDGLMAIFGAKRMMEDETFIAWGTDMNEPGFSIIKPFDGKQATVGNGGMIALKADSEAMVDQIYHKALELGGGDEGAPGLRGGGFYAAYFRDLDGNKLNTFCMKAAD